MHNRKETMLCVPTVSSQGFVPLASFISETIFGAIRNAVALQDANEAFLFIADLHAITETPDPQVLAEHTFVTAVLYLACGVDPSCATLYVQSQLPAHAQLARLLGAVAPVSELKRMIQFKEKATRQGEDVNLSLLDYPVLMAADILLYQTDLVPVGDDQRQHIELARLLADRFNKRFCGGCSPVFKVPEALIVPSGARLMSLTDGTKKMSKSDPNDLSRINLMDSPDTIRVKVKRAKTDSLPGLEFDNPARPEVHNLLTIYQLMAGKSRDDVLAQCASMSYSQFKPLLAECIVSGLAPVQTRYRELMQDRQYVASVLRHGCQRAGAIAEETLERAFTAMGFLRLDERCV